jgi:hypothetical protein
MCLQNSPLIAPGVLQRAIDDYKMLYNKNSPEINPRAVSIFRKKCLLLHNLLYNIITKNKYHQGNQYYKPNNLGAFQELIA